MHYMFKDYGVRICPMGGFLGLSVLNFTFGYPEDPAQHSFSEEYLKDFIKTTPAAAVRINGVDDVDPCALPDCQPLIDVCNTLNKTVILVCSGAHAQPQGVTWTTIIPRLGEFRMHPTVRPNEIIIRISGGTIGFDILIPEEIRNLYSGNIYVIPAEGSQAEVENLVKKDFRLRYGAQLVEV